MPLYVDPGAGSLLVQLGISAILGVVFFFHRAVARGWQSVRDVVSRMGRQLGVPSKPRAAEEERTSPADHRPRP